MGVVHADSPLRARLEKGTATNADAAALLNELERVEAQRDRLRQVARALNRIGVARALSGIAVEVDDAVRALDALHSGDLA